MDTEVSYNFDDIRPLNNNEVKDAIEASWDARYKAICYLIFKADGSFEGQTTDTSFTVSDADATYTVKAANKYGTLSE